MSATVTFKYRNKTDEELMIPGYGIVKPHDILETSEKLNNPNLEIVFDGDSRIGVVPVTKKPSKK